jgi:hypothetical protein
MNAARPSLAAGAALLLLLAGSAGRAAPPAAVTNELDSVKATYAGARQRIEGDCDQRKAAAVAVYGKSLTNLLTSLKQQGNLDAYLLVRSEQKRFAETGTLPTGTNAVPAVTPLLEQYRAALADARNEADRRLTGLQQQYATRLDGLVKQLMAQDRIEDAQQARAELDRIRSELTFASSMNQAVRPPEPPAAKPDTPPTPAKTEHHLLFTAKRVAGREDSISRKEMASYESYHDARGVFWHTPPVELRFVYASQTVEVSLRNVGAVTDNISVECLFFQQEASSDKTSLSERKKQDVELKPDTSRTLTFKSPTLRCSADKLLIERKPQRMGDRPYGYIVVLSDSNGIFRAASNKELEDLLKDRNGLADIVKNGRLPE